MKKLILFILFASTLLIAQEKLNEQQAIEQSHIDFTKQLIYFVIHGNIEINGHTFYNDTCKSPIIFRADLNGISIIDTLTNTEYQHRNCGKKDCSTIHLEVKQANVIQSPQPFWRLYQKNDNGITPL